MAGNASNVEAFNLDVADDAALAQAVSAVDVVVRWAFTSDCDRLHLTSLSLLPAPMHPQVAKHCISHGKHLVTASYISPDMAAVDQA